MGVRDKFQLFAGLVADFSIETRPEGQEKYCDRSPTYCNADSKKKHVGTVTRPGIEWVVAENSDMSLRT